MIDVRHAVLLHKQEIGVMHQRGDFVRFSFLSEYWDDPDRSVLGLWFEENTDASVSSSLKLPAWFANLLPEGRLREMIARDRDVSADREMELLAQVGHDLPGAVEIVDGVGADLPWSESAAEDAQYGAELSSGPVKFSLAGVGLKFSMMRTGDRFTVPASGGQGDHWIVKLPDSSHPLVPQNEHAMMSLASQCGIEVPEIHLLHRDMTFGLPDDLWNGSEEWAYAVSRFDRGSDGEKIHIEDFAQVRNFQPQKKYEGSFETVAALAFRGHDRWSLEQVVRRITFNLAVGNGDAHLKNWSLIYPDGRTPRISPAYDIVSTVPYIHDDTTGLRLNRSRRFEDFRPSAWWKLENRLGVDDGSLQQVSVETFQRLEDAFAHSTAFEPGLKFVHEWISRRLDSLRPRFG